MDQSSNKKANVLMVEQAPDRNFKPQDNLTPEEQLYRSSLMKRVYNAYYQREQARPEWNDMTYIQRYITNRKQGIAYIPPRKDVNDIEVVTGTVHNKILTLLSILKKYNYEQDIVAYDQDNRAYIELGKVMDGITTKVLKMDEEDTKETLQLVEYLQQGDVFVLVEYVEGTFLDKVIDNPDAPIDEQTWTDTIKNLQGKITTTVIPGINFYFGDINQFFMHKQPFVFIYTIERYENVESRYGRLKKWKDVPKILTNFGADAPLRDQNGFVTLSNDIKEGFCEVIRYFDKPNNEYQVIVNGTMLLPVRVKNGVISGYPLSECSPSREYPIAKGSGEPFSEYFAYSKSNPEDTKILGEINDEMLRMMLLKTYQSFNPPRGNLTGKQLNKKINSPGAFFTGIKPEQVPILLDAKGVTDSEIAAYNIIRGLIDEGTAANIMSGDSESGKQTATEIEYKRQQSMAKLGIRLAGFVSLKQQIAWLIIFFVITKFTKVQEEKLDEVTGELMKKYRTLVDDSVLENGKKGMKIFKFDPKKANQPSRDTMIEENSLSDHYQKPVRLVYLNPEALKDTCKWIWDVKIVPTPEETTELRKAQFKDTISFIFSIPQLAQMLNIQYIGEKLALNEDLNPDELFSIQQGGSQAMQFQQMLGGQLPGGGTTEEGMQQINGMMPNLQV